MRTTLWHMSLGIFLITLACIAGDARADRALAEENGWIYNDLDAAIRQGQETGRPLMVVLRCPP